MNDHRLVPAAAPGCDLNLSPSDLETIGNYPGYGLVGLAALWGGPHFQF